MLNLNLIIGATYPMLRDSTIVLLIFVVTCRALRCCQKQVFGIFYELIPDIFTKYDAVSVK